MRGVILSMPSLHIIGQLDGFVFRYKSNLARIAMCIPFVHEITNLVSAAGVP